jgi:osmotically inducible protein OsmC
MIIRHAEATWEGDLPKGGGTVKTHSGALDSKYSFATRFENGVGGTNPEELLGAAHAACFAMALSHGLASGGHTATRVTTKADVTIDKVGEGFKITKILLTIDAVVPGLDDGGFQAAVKATEKACPVSQALAATPIEVKATLVK